MTTTAVTISDTGPIHDLSAPIPHNGGVLVLRGGNGTGKSTAIAAIGALLGTADSRRLTARHGALVGLVEGFGVRLRIGQRTTRGGELEVAGFSDELDLGQLIDPGFKDPAAADRRRVQALARLSGLAVDLEPWDRLFGGREELLAAVSPETLALTDVVEMAERVRRETHARALDVEKQAAALEAQSAGARAGLNPIPEPLPDTAAIRVALEAAVREEASMQQRARQRVEREAARQIASERLERIRGGWSGPTEIEALEAAERAARMATAATSEMDSAHAALAAAQQDYIAAQARHAEAAAAAKLAHEVHVAASQRMSTLAAAESTLAELASEPVEGWPTEARLAEARERVVLSRQAVEQRAVWEAAAAKLRHADDLAVQAANMRGVAERLRAVARATDDVLAEMLGPALPAGMALREGRLTVRQGDREVYLADLSDGERTRLAAEMVIGAAPPRRPEDPPLPLPMAQGFWEGLDGEARALLRAVAREKRFLIVTAQADAEGSGPLRAEVLE